MSTKNNYHIIGNFIQLIDKYRTPCAQVIDNKLIVHHFMTHVDRRAKGFKGTIDNIDSAVDTGTKTAGIS